MQSAYDFPYFVSILKLFVFHLICWGQLLQLAFKGRRQLQYGIGFQDGTSCVLWSVAALTLSARCSPLMGHVSFAMRSLCFCLHAEQLKGAGEQQKGNHNYNYNYNCICHCLLCMCVCVCFLWTECDWGPFRCCWWCCAGVWIKVAGEVGVRTESKAKAKVKPFDAAPIINLPYCCLPTLLLLLLLLVYAHNIIKINFAWCTTLLLLL